MRNAALPFSSLTGATSASAAPPNPASAGELFLDVLPILLVLAGLILVGWLLILWLRRRIRTEPSVAEGFTLDDLRRLHREGELSRDEYERAKRTLLAKVPNREELLAQLPPRSRPVSRRDTPGTDGG